MINSLLSRLGIEVWKDVLNYEGHYQVSNLGNVRSIKFNKIKQIKHLITTSKRWRVNLYKKGKKTSTNNRISVLVAEAFLNHKKCGHKLVVDHIDNNQINDKLYNLQVITHRQNLTKDRKNRTGYTGVNKSKSGNRFNAGIRDGKKLIYLGSYKTPEEASQAYQKALSKLI
tara:strand:+ start:1973 stop:2485 length:513 start_codon:yes stop_codon:yes gene_type:complete